MFGKMITLTVFGVVFLAGLVAFAGDKVEAKKHFEAGLSLQKTDDFKGAVFEFETSVKLYPTKGGLYNLANCYRALHRYGEALSTFAKLQSQYGAKFSAEMKSDVKSQLAEIENVVARLKVTVSPGGASVFVDGESLDKGSVGQKIVLGPGEHMVKVQLDGYEPQERKVTLPSRSDQTERFELKKQVVAVAPVVKPEPKPKPKPAVESTDQPSLTPSNGLKIAGGLITGIGGAMLITGIITGAVSKKKQGELDDLCTDKVCDDSSYKGIEDKRDTLALTTDIMLIGGGVIAVTGVIILIAGNKNQETQDAPSLATMLTPVASPNYVGLSLKRSF